MGQRARLQRGVDLVTGLGDPEEIAQPFRPLADVVAHRHGHILVPAGGDQRLGEKAALGAPAAGKPPADDQKQLRDRPGGTGDEHISENTMTVQPLACLGGGNASYAARIGIKRSLYVSSIYALDIEGG
jgi:hypothetical protein